MTKNTEILLRELAEKLGTTSENVFNILVAQAPLQGLFNLLASILFIVIIHHSFKFLKKQKESLNEDGFFMLGLLLGVCGIITIVYTLITFSTNVSALINPEYWALKQILDVIK